MSIATSWQTTLIFIASSGLLLSFVNLLLHAGVKRLEAKVTQVLPQPIAADVNKVLEAIERIVEIAVQDANGRIVLGLKAQNLFTVEVATSIKASVRNDILTNLGPLAMEAAQLLGPIETIVEQMIEKHVLQHKQ